MQNIRVRYENDSSNVKNIKHVKMGFCLVRNVQIFAFMFSQLFSMCFS